MPEPTSSRFARARAWHGWSTLVLGMVLPIAIALLLTWYIAP